MMATKLTNEAISSWMILAGFEKTLQTKSSEFWSLNGSEDAASTVAAERNPTPAGTFMLVNRVGSMVDKDPKEIESAMAELQSLNVTECHTFDEQLNNIASLGITSDSSTSNILIRSLSKISHAADSVTKLLSDPMQMTVVVHLDGDGVKQHGVDGVALSDFMKGICQSATIVAKESGIELRRKQKSIKKKIPKEHFGQPVIVEAIQMGSLEFSIRTTPVPSLERDDATGEKGTQSKIATREQSVDDRALESVLKILTSDGEIPLLSEIPQSARAELLKSAKALRDQSIEASFTTKQRFSKSNTITAKRKDLVQLVSILEAPKETTEALRDIMQLDGWRDSSERVYLIVDSNPLSFEASDDILAKVRRMQASADFEGWLDCTYSRKIVETPGKKTQVSYELHSVHLAGAPELKSPEPSDQQELDLDS